MIELDYSAPLQLAYKGIRRAYVFLGFGWNAANDPDFTKYSLQGVVPIQMVPDDISAETMQDFKSNFGRWIVGCGLRELIETFGVFLDKLFELSMWVKVYKKEIEGADADSLLRQFVFMGIEKKSIVLEENFGFKPRHSDFIASISLARNCLTHRLGIVDENDCKEENLLRIKWIGLDGFLESESGERKFFDLIMKEPVETFPKGESQFGMIFVERQLEFKEGHVIDIPPKALGEMCYFFQREVQGVWNKAIEYTKIKGIENETVSPSGDA